MIRTAALFSVAFAALAACSEQADAPAGTAVASADREAPAAKGGEVQPGLWEVSLTTAPGEEPTVDRECIEPGQIDLQAQLLKNTADSDECTFAKREIGRGRINIDTQCNSPEGPFKMKLTGDYSATTLNYELTTGAIVNGQTIPVNWKVKSRRIAATCPADEG